LFEGSLVDGRIGIPGGGIFAKQSKGGGADDNGHDNAGNTGGEQPAVVNGFVVEGIVKAEFYIILRVDWGGLVYGEPLNTR